MTEATITTYEVSKADKRKALAHYDAYKRSSSYELYDVYGRYSSAKARAWDYCKGLMNDHGGYGLKIISANGYQFTAGFMIDMCDGSKLFAYITKSGMYCVEVA